MLTANVVEFQRKVELDHESVSWSSSCYLQDNLTKDSSVGGSSSSTFRNDFSFYNRASMIRINEHFVFQGQEPAPSDPHPVFSLEADPVPLGHRR